MADSIAQCKNNYDRNLQVLLSLNKLERLSLASLSTEATFWCSIIGYVPGLTLKY